MPLEVPAHFWIGAVLLLAFVFAGCASDTEESSVIATVDGLDLSDDDFKRSYIDYLVTTGQNDTEANRRRHFDALVDAYLLGAEAERQGMADDSALVAEARLARRRLIGARFYEATVLDTLAAPTEEEVQEAYALGREQRVVRQLYYTSAVEAQAAFARMQNGSTFEAEAQALYQTDEPLAGSLGAISYWEVDDAFAEAAFATPVGAVTQPVRTRLGWHIIRVDDRIRNPLMSESEYERRRKGTESQVRLRRRRMEGDAFVRSFMEARNVSVSRPALLALQDAIRNLGDLEPDAEQGSSQAFTASEQGLLLETLAPSTPLATFVLDGKEQTFTVADYVFWLGVLPPQEARGRTGASLGRALRNEVFARAGEAAGLADDPEIRHELEKQRRLQLADALRAQLRLRDTSGADSLRLASAAEDLRLAPQQTVADFWALPFATRAEAEAALPGLRASPEAAARRPGFRDYVAEPLASVPSFAAAVRAAPIGQPALASVGEGWAVIRVSNRRTEATGTGAEVLAPFLAEVDLLRDLRRQRPLRVLDDRLQALLQPPSVPQRRR